MQVLHLLTIIFPFLILLSCSTLACAGPDLNNLTIKLIFTVDIRVSKSLKPIPICGGQLFLLPITGDCADGPALNGTIKSGFVRASYYENRTVEYPSNMAYGTMDDGENFVIEQKGAGSAGGQAARLVSDFAFFSLIRYLDNPRGSMFWNTRELTKDENLPRRLMWAASMPISGTRLSWHEMEIIPRIWRWRSRVSAWFETGEIQAEGWWGKKMTSIE